MPQLRGDHSPVASITTAPVSKREDIARRQRRYLISMTIRTVCFVLAVVFRDYWFWWILLIAAFLLPTIAVIVANSEGSMGRSGGKVVSPNVSRPELRAPEERG